MTERPQGRSLELYFIEGRPDGMLTAEVFNWTGHLLMAPRTQIGAALARKEARHAGAYLLLGEREGEPMAYVGEGDDISQRIKNHNISKDWWTTMVLVTSAANNLNGRPANGTIEWKVKGTGRTYKDWEAAQLGSAP